MKKYLLLVMLLYVGFANAQSDSISRFTKIISIGLKPNSKIPWKNPGTTAIHTLILPGTGYLANDKMLLGCATLLLEPALLTGGYLAYEVLEIDALAYAAFGLAGTIHLVQLVHSVWLTHRSNKINGYVMENQPKPKGMELGLSVTGNGMGVNLRF